MNIDSEVLPRLATLLETKPRVYIVATGAGAGLQDMIWRLPGCSSFLIGASFPYAKEESDKFLGFEPEKYCSPPMALDLAMEAYSRAWAPGATNVIGLGLTASVSSTRAHRGDHRVFVAAMTSTKVLAGEITLDKGIGLEARVKDGQAADLLGMELLLAANGQSSREFHDVTEVARKRFLERSFFRADGTRTSVEDGIKTGDIMIYPGAFNPPHQGHLEVSWQFEETETFVYAITVDPPHKDAVPLADMVARAKLLAGHNRMFTQGDGYYLEKIRRYPGSKILIGADAFIRMYDPKWDLNMDEVFQECERLGVTFQVIGRRIGDRFISLESIRNREVEGVVLPSRFLHLLRSVPGRWDVSSTELRTKAQS